MFPSCMALVTDKDLAHTLHETVHKFECLLSASPVPLWDERLQIVRSLWELLAASNCCAVWMHKHGYRGRQASYNRLHRALHSFKNRWMDARERIEKRMSVSIQESMQSVDCISKNAAQCIEKCIGGRHFTEAYCRKVNASIYGIQRKVFRATSGC